MKNKLTALFLSATLMLGNGASFAQEKPAPSTTRAFADAQKPKIEFSFKGLTNHKGEAVKDNDFEGKQIILYYGYPDCQAICPVAAANIVGALTAAEKKTPGSTANIIPVFITSQTGYTTEQIKAWRDKFNGESVHAVVMTGPAEVLDPLYKSFRVRGPANTHTPFAYFIGSDGKFEGIVQTQTGQKPLVDAIEEKFPKPAAAPTTAPAPEPQR